MAAPLTKQEIEMLEACASPQDWAKACTEIKKARGGVEYPSDWWKEMKLSGRMDRIMSRWGSASELQIETF